MKTLKLFVVILALYFIECFQPASDPLYLTISFISMLDSLRLSNLFINAYLCDENNKINKIEIDSSDFIISIQYNEIIDNSGNVSVTNEFEYYHNPLRFDITVLGSSLDTIGNGSFIIKLTGGINDVLAYFAKKYDVTEPYLNSYIKENQAIGYKFYRKSFGLFYNDSQTVAIDSVFFIYMGKN